MNQKNLGALSSSVNPQELSRTIEGVMKAVGGALVFFGVASVTDVNTLTGQISQLVTLGYAFFGVAEAAFGLIRKIIVAINERV
ncbi:hypothetical protein C4568_03585 [Candidatus Parcubacteria bacterium]|nr:MAG: hypothetical protein C4568_03585 [Candidatus Parcubacteria bacterium]